MADIETTPTEPEVVLTPMEKFVEKIKSKTTEYGVNASNLAVTFALSSADTLSPNSSKVFSV